jgi:hypothetical protein
MPCLLRMCFHMYACMYVCVCVLLKLMDVNDASSVEDVLSYVCVYVCMYY